jgi:hypothetical protein
VPSGVCLVKRLGWAATHTGRIKQSNRREQGRIWVIADARHSGSFGNYERLSCPWSHDGDLMVRWVQAGHET